MGLIKWLASKLGGQPVPVSGGDLCAMIDEYAADAAIRETAFAAAVNVVANAIGKCEIKTYENGEEKRGSEWYLWNIEPNKNQNSSGFIHKLILQLYRNGEALVVDQNGQLLVADSFSRAPYALYDDVFSGVTVGSYTFARSYVQEEVLYWQLGDQKIKGLIDRLYSTYAKLIGYAMKAYQQSRGTKGILYYDSIPIAGTEQRAAWDNLIGTRMREWLNSDRAALPLGKGQEFKELSHKTYSNESTRDIRALIDDIGDFTARAFGIPPALLRGDVQDTSKAIDQLLTFCIDPLADMLQEEINRKRNGRAAVLAGTYHKIDTRAIKHVDLLSAATSIDKLIGSGAFSINDIRRLTGEQPINEPWADEHYITKNYERAQDTLNPQGG